MLAATTSHTLPSCKMRHMMQEECAPLLPPLRNVGAMVYDDVKVRVKKEDVVRHDARDVQHGGLRRLVKRVTVELRLDHEHCIADLLLHEHQPRKRGLVRRVAKHLHKLRAA